MRQDRRFAELMALLAIVNRDQKKRKHPYKGSDFMPDYLGANKKKEQTPDEMKQTLLAMVETDGQEWSE